MSRITDNGRDVYRREMTAAKAAGTAEARWHHLERAHIVSQPDPWLHTCNHAAMFVLAVRQRDRREALGQVVRSSSPHPVHLRGATPRATRAGRRRA